MNRGVFLSFEGGEGTGKTSQLALLKARLERQGRTVTATREPGGTLLGRTIRELLVQHSPDPPDPLAELLLYAADRAHHVTTLILPALRAGRVVLCDRYADATEAYQGWGRELPLDAVREANRLATGGLQPERTILLDLEPELGIGRALRREAPKEGPREERFEAEDLSFHRRVREGYLDIARRDAHRVRIVSAAGSPEEVAERIWEELRGLFGSGFRG